MKQYKGLPNETAQGEIPNYFYNAIETEAKGSDLPYKEAYMELAKAFPNATPMELATTANGIVVVGVARSHGKRFIFSDKLKEALLNTDTPKSVPEIRLPFKALIIEEWCIAEVDGVIRGVRFYDDNKLDFMRFNANENYQDVREKYGSIINMILYLTSEKPDMERALRKPQKVKGVKRSTISNEVVYVGRSYKGMKSSLPAGAGRQSLTTRFAVRGHWRNQVIKDGHKRIFIEPYWKGPDMGEIVNKMYKVV